MNGKMTAKPAPRRRPKAAPKPAAPAAPVSPRAQDIYNAAAALFAERGYHGTSVRDIGERVGLLGGSLYHHIKSKEALFVAIHNTALRRAADKIEAAIAGLESPWARLEAASVTLAELQLDPASVTMPLMNEFFQLPPELRAQLIATRDDFEALFDRLVQALDLPAEIDPKIYRICLLTQLNSLCHWYRPGKYTPAEIGHEVMKIFRPRA
ncbi:TetR/AcrR family transcriptional regulator [Acidocella sp. KAb 2-4]|uniref:TetR/AcrR family transcriptional regulator n=1 Tax=Acidocella sp. KAb 2-4 TaxID=2885158 RepID=UPI001D069B84|nr:TetR/AcrR family transcriptional regulator [Acidocella sp. KAb 2-4]MCB5943809.1 TetR/AcrR family transcriptional regulator [Acidocella sp. KAb 2-4]